MLRLRSTASPVRWGILGESPPEFGDPSTMEAHSSENRRSSEAICSESAGDSSSAIRTTSGRQPSGLSRSMANAASALNREERGEESSIFLGE